VKKALEENAMTAPISRRTALKLGATGCLSLPMLLPAEAEAARRAPPGWVMGKMTGARALVEALKAEGTDCVFGIPGAQENELWDEMKSRGLPYLLVTHELSAAVMADGAARSTGKPGVLCVVPGPGVTNALTGIGEALLDSVPLVCVVGDVARGDQYRPFQVHSLANAALLRPVTKEVLTVAHAGEICQAIRQAFALSQCGEPGPVAVVIPYNLLIETAHFHCGPLAPLALPLDEHAFQCALGLLRSHKLRVGLYVGLGCMDHGPALMHLAEVLQAPVATSVSGKGVINECHPLAAGWGYGPQGTRAAEQAFKAVDLVLAIGVRYSEVSTAFYNIPKHRHLIHVDANPRNLGRVVKADVCVHADAGVFLHRLLAHAEELARSPSRVQQVRLNLGRRGDARAQGKDYGKCGVDPMALLLTLRRATCQDALVFVDVTLSEHWAAEAFKVYGPRTYFNPTDNQSMGWSIPAALGAQRVHPGRQTITITGDGCLLMSAMELSTAARECLPVKFFILDDQAYRYMQALQEQAYRRTTATVLADLDYAALARAMGVGYVEVHGPVDLESGVQTALALPGPVLVRIATDYGDRPMRWLEATRERYTQELSAAQKARFLARLGVRTLRRHQPND
jgi:acetolactate synthase-1/2/3 large subunit